MVAWMSYLMGDLEMAERDSAAMVARLMPGQAPYPALHLYAGGRRTLFPFGRWAEATALFWRCIEAWHDAGSHAAGYALRGFGVGLDIGRARGDARLSGAATEAMESILSRFPQAHHYRVLLVYIQGEHAFIEEDPYLHGNTPAETAERRLSLACDRREQLPQFHLAHTLAKALQTHVPLVEAQARRARGLAPHDVAEVSRASEVWERIGAVPPLGPGRGERGLLNGGRAGVQGRPAGVEKTGGQVHVTPRVAW